MSSTNENRPLIPTAETPSTSYDSIIFIKNNEEEKSYNSNGETSIRIDKPKSGILQSKLDYFERIIYTWNNINVNYIPRNNRGWRGFSRRNQSIEQKKILKNVCGIAYPGELLIIMGSSGAGKTTLLNALTFRSGKGITVSGTMAVNGKRVTSSVLTSTIAYVQQDDLFIGTLTVMEHLLFQAMLRMDRHIPYGQRVNRVNDVISELALTKCKDTVIGVPGRIKGLSGGEMKRLSVASEVLTNPSLMFCDEPTSGLDSFMAYQVITVLKDLAARGKTIIATLHQPSSELYALFDKILLMAEGRVAYLGSPEQAYNFFKLIGAVCPSNYNPADYYIQVLAVVSGREVECRHTINTICDKFDKSDIGIKIITETRNIQGELIDSLKDSKSKKYQSPYKASWCEQFRAVFWRSWLAVIKNPELVKVRFLQTLMTACLIGLIYYGQKLDQNGVMNINGALFIFLTNMTFQNILAVINVFCEELPIFLKEHKNGMYRTGIYFICKTLTETPVFILVPFMFTCIVYPAIGLYPGVDHFFITASILILVTNVATSFGYFISCATSNISIALSIGPPVIIPFLLFGGFFLNTASVPVYFQWLSYLSWFRYGNQALLINQWAQVDIIDCTQNNSTCPKSGHMVLETYNVNENEFLLNIINLIILMISFRIFAYMALLSKTKR